MFADHELARAPIPDGVEKILTVVEKTRTATAWLQDHDVVRLAGFVDVAVIRELEARRVDELLIRE